MKDSLRRAAVPALSFLIPGLVMLWAFAAVGMAPWGDKTVLISDMSSQYVDFFCALKNGDLFFSWSKALGTAYIGVFSYYVSSPLSFLTLLVPNEAMPVGLLFLIVLKIALAGLSFSLYARRRFPIPGTAVVLGAVCYALMSYNAAYAICVMWLDGVIWLPLILLALERILAGRSAGPFIAALTVCFISTWYISYMVGVFCALCLCARLVVLRPKRDKLGRILVRFFGGAACALGLTAWLWLPTFLAMFNGKFSGGNADYPSLLLTTPLDLLSQLRAGQYSSIGYGAAPYIFCGTAAAVLAAAYFFQSRYSMREKLAHGAMLAVLTASLLFSPLDKAWHLFQRPNWFPFRYSFVVSFFLVYLAVQALPVVLRRLRERAGQRMEQAIAVALICLTVLELSVNTVSILSGLEEQYGSDPYGAYQSSYTANAALVKAAREDAGDEFFRMGATEDRGFNSPLAFGYAGLTHYSSLYNYDVNTLTRRLGFAQSWMWCAYYGSTPVTDALLGVRYVISRDELPYEVLKQAGGYTLYKNPDVLPVAFLSAGEDAPVLSAAATPFERQNDLLSALAGAPAAAFTPVDAEVWNAGTEVSFTVTGTGRAIYADLSASGLRQVLVNGEPVLSLGANEAASVHYLGAPGAGEMWTVTVRHSGSWFVPERFLWELDSPEQWESRWPAVAGAVQAVDKAETAAVEKSGTVRLSVTTDSARQLLTTVPAEDGWRAYVDGKRVETGIWLNTFLSLSIPAGGHQVELRYTAPGLIPGLTLGAISVAGLALIYTKRNLSRRKYQKKRESAP